MALSKLQHPTRQKQIFTSSFNIWLWRPSKWLFWLLHWKICTIRNNFPPPNPSACPDTSFAGNPLLTFESVTDEFVLKIINSASAKSCELDPIPTTLLYENLDILLPTIMNIISTSLTASIAPHDLKTAIIKPLLKKPSLDRYLLKNYCPISNLPFLSKILENVILHKRLSHLQENNLSNPFQSAYRARHSTETILFRIVNDILSALDNDNISVLLLLDLSAAFDTIEHQLFLSCLNSVFGIQSTAFQWFQSYLSDRYQSTPVSNSSSSPTQLMYNVPQGSVLGPILFVLYTTPLSDIIAIHSVNHQLFTDDTQLQKAAPLSEVTNLIQYKLATLAFRHIDGALLPYLSSSLCTYHPSRSRHSSTERLLKIPKTNLKIFDECSSGYIALTVWNALPADLRASPCLPTVKVNLKMRFFRQAFWLMPAAACFIFVCVCVCACVSVGGGGWEGWY